MLLHRFVALNILQMLLLQYRHLLFVHSYRLLHAVEVFLEGFSHFLL